MRLPGLRLRLLEADVTDLIPYADYVRIEIHAGGRAEVMEFRPDDDGKVKAEVNRPPQQYREAAIGGIIRTLPASGVAIEVKVTGPKATITRKDAPEVPEGALTEDEAWRLADHLRRDRGRNEEGAEGGSAVTLDEAEGHIGNPVMAVARRVVEGVVARVDRDRHMVGVRERRRTHPYDLLPTVQWWHPRRLSVPQWWYDRQEAK